MISQVGHDVQNAYRLAELTQSLQLLKKQSWKKRRQESEKIKAQVKSCQTPNGSQQTLLRDISGTVRYLQDELRHQMEEHIREGKADVDQVQQRVCRIQQLREALRDEMVKHRDAGEKSDPFQQSQLEYSSAQEQRRRLKEDHGKLIQEEVEKMQRDLAQDQTEGLQRELRILTRERQVLVLQIEALRAEALQAEKDLKDQYQKHQTELHCLREESLQVFRVYRHVNEEQRKTSEGRYRTVLLDAVQDAVYLSAQNQQLQANNKQLRKELGHLKDALVVQGDPKADRLPPKQ
ncbi:uncharacterized protein LOC117520162 [Thalassophryne amazonica]|uniref:uncharacterized protein LOC117520162 n=1 Tax=Thalassophryne amazonica TaxID=390379 RepID=UPI00147086F6|nr:uncharacterized protein LOC117520162 [Thalassophryne amazonica]XP_034037365.1 uncharacterized protein LOC117520162 [Thalassophryne amazonica]